MPFQSTKPALFTRAPKRAPRWARRSPGTPARKLPQSRATALEEHRGGFSLGGNGRLPGGDGEGFSGQDKAAPALPPRGSPRCCPRRAGPGGPGHRAKAEGGPAGSRPTPLPVSNSFQRCETDPRAAVSRLSSSSRTDTCRAQGRVPEPREDGDPTSHCSAQHRGSYLPVSLVVHGNEIHEEHVISHGVHPEYLHLEGGEHAPGTERRERRAELRGSGDPRRTGADTRGCSGPGAGTPQPSRPFPSSSPSVRPVANSGPLAGTAGRNGRKRQMRPGSVSRGTDRSCRILQQHPEGRAGAALGGPASLASSGAACVGHPKCSAAAGRKDWGGNKRRHFPLCHGESQVKRISSPRFPHLSS